MGGGLIFGKVSQGRLTHNFDEIISVENLLEAWREFVPGKRLKRDVIEFSLHLMDNILALHSELAQQTYCHGGYYAFRLSDPKPRDIHKASVRDRLVHHAVYRILYPHFSRFFIADSFSCQLGKGMHRALNRFQAFAYKVSRNNTRTCWVLKCDIRKFFASIDQEVLIDILKRSVADIRTLALLEGIIHSFHTVDKPGIGLPLGNLTSQLLVNIYMNEFDLFAKHELKAKYYIRYADDFVFLSEDKAKLEILIPRIRDFLKTRLQLELHPDKLFLKTLASGVDFLGWVHFPGHRVLRTASKKRMMRRVQTRPTDSTIASYQGMLSHGNAKKLEQMLNDILDI